MATLPPLASVEALSDWIGEPITADSADAKRAEGALRLASQLVRRVSRRTWMDGEELVDDLPDEVELITKACAAREYLNPEHHDTVRTDDFYGTVKVEETGMYLTDSEKDLLRSLTTANSSGLGTVATTRGDIPILRLLDGDEDEERILPPYY